MKLLLLYFCLACFSVTSFCQDKLVRTFVRQVLPPSDSFKSISRERQRSISADLIRENDGEGKKIVLLTTANKQTAEREAAYIGRLKGQEVYRVDLSTIVSKYIGETEKNLELLFARAEDKKWVLFFDESDSLFGKQDEKESAADTIYNLAKKKKVTVIFHCNDDCLRKKKISYVLMRE